MLKNVYSVGQVNSYIKNMFDQDFMLRNICVKGEISNCKYHSSGHIYFTLKDDTGVLSSIMYASKKMTGLSFRMKEGDKVAVTGSIHVYERDGKYQLYADKIELDGEGNLYLKFEALKKELEEMGMFSHEYKRPIPKYAHKIGVVTAPTGAAIQDIRNISSRRNPYVQLILYPALVQGENAALSIVDGIKCLENLGVDVIIVGRGGGSIEDLWAFNEEIVARAIFDCSVPIISAVGHETDTTIADYVADLRAPTPSAAAELAVYDYKLVYESLLHYKFQFNRRMQNIVELQRKTLENKKTKLRFLNPSNRLLDKRRVLVDYEERLHRLMNSKIEANKHRYEILYQKLEALSPIKKLSMGYAFVEKKECGKLHSISQVSCGDDILVYLKDGNIKATVAEVSQVERK